MSKAVEFLSVAGPLFAVSWWLSRRSAESQRHALWPAFSATAVSAILLIAGFTGYNLNALDAAAAGTHWRGDVIWWQVGIGMALLPVAAYYWRRGIRFVSS